MVIPNGVSVGMEMTNKPQAVQVQVVVKEITTSKEAIKTKSNLTSLAIRNKPMMATMGRCHLRVWGMRVQVQGHVLKDR